MSLEEKTNLIEWMHNIIMKFEMFFHDLQDWFENTIMQQEWFGNVVAELESGEEASSEG
jgi:hypothetical protein